jgi:hypothetical protein
MSLSVLIDLSCWGPMNFYDRLPVTARAALDASGIDPGELENAFNLPPDAGLLLVGSHADGRATEKSDLDFLVLLEDDEELPGVDVGDTISFSYGFLDRKLVLLGTQEFDLELMHWRHLPRFGESLQDLTRLSAQSESTSASFPVFLLEEIRALNRLRTGVPIRGMPRVERWRAGLNLENLSLYRALSCFLNAMSWIEDAVNLQRAGATDFGPAVAARVGAEELLLGTLAYHGRVLVDLRFAAHYSDVWKKSGDPIPGALDDMQGLLFPQSDSLADYPNRIYELAVELFHFYDHDGRQPGLVPGIRWFGRNRWHLDLSFLGLDSS